MKGEYTATRMEEQIFAQLPVSATWREKSRAVITETCLVFMDITGEAPRASMSQQDKLKLLKMVDASYPFGDRAMFPYKAWLKERRHLIGQLWPTHAPIDSGLFEKLAVLNAEGV